MPVNRPQGRKKNVTGPGAGVHKRNETVSGGPVGSADGYADRTGSSGGRTTLSGGRNGGSGGGSPLKLIIILLIVLLGGGGGLGTYLSGGGGSSSSGHSAGRKRGRVSNERDRELLWRRIDECRRDLSSGSVCNR